MMDTCDKCKLATDTLVYGIEDDVDVAEGFKFHRCTIKMCSTCVGNLSIVPAAPVQYYKDDRVIVYGTIVN